MNKKLKNEVWEKEKYLALAERGSLDTEHPGMKLLLEVASKKRNILDLGCGEGTRLGMIDGERKNLTGIDVSETAIKKAKVKYPKIDFFSGNIEKLPFKNGVFDLIYSVFVFEHLDKPEAVIKEAVKVLKIGGNLFIIAPNFGAPNRASPSFKGSRFEKLVIGFLNDLFRPFIGSNSLKWNKVKPIANAKAYEMDWDTTIEPYLGSLIPFVKNRGLTVVNTMACWEEEEKGANLMQKIFRFLGEKNIYPFKNWGPHLVLLAQK